MSVITTHILDVARGRPAAGISVTLEVQMEGHSWKVLGKGRSDADGRVANLFASGRLEAGAYRLTFDVGPYFRAQNVDSFYPIVCVEFSVRDPSQHYHVPLLLSPFGYSTYRGS